ncbi:MAG: YncE family protein [Acidobacteriaceae bacterium]|nr:YncE family protein [Acidobacteriaceae bacterium]
MPSRLLRIYSHLAAAAVLSLLPQITTAQQGPYHVADHWTIGGEGGWDYLLADGPAHRLYIAHNSRVEAVDTQTGKPVGAVTGMKSTHGIALDPNGKTGYISDGAGNAVVVFDRATLEKLATIAAGTNPDGILYEPFTRTVWAFNGRSRNVSVIDPVTRTVVTTIPLPGKPEFPVADGKGTVFVNIEDKNSIARLDAKTRQVVTVWPLAGCESPSGLAFDHAGQRLFSVCDGGKMAVTSAVTGKSLATPAIGGSPDAAGYDAKHKLAFSSNGGDATLSVVDASGTSYPTIQSLKTEKGARTMTLDPVTGKIYLAYAQYGPAPAPTASSPRPRPAIIPGSFSILVVSR